MPFPITPFCKIAQKAALSAIIALTLAGGSALADELTLQDNAPERYVVVKGDTLWAISGKYLKDPWKWPQLWKMNQEEIKNPHWIFPGDVIILDTSSGTPQLRLLRNDDNDALRGQVVKVGPHVRVTAIEDRAAPAIPRAQIEPLLSHPLIVEEGDFNKAPRIALLPPEHVTISRGDNFYTAALPGSTGDEWQIYTSPREVRDPDTKELLGYEVTYCGDADTTAIGSVSTLQVKSTVREIVLGDRLIAKERQPITNYVPHVPLTSISGKILSTYGSNGEAGQYATVLINKGTRDGLAPGHVLLAYKAARALTLANGKADKLMAPAEQSGTIYVYRVFQKLAYGLVVNSTQPIAALDAVHTP